MEELELLKPWSYLNSGVLADLFILPIFWMLNRKSCLSVIFTGKVAVVKKDIKDNINNYEYSPVSFLFF